MTEEMGTHLFPKLIANSGANPHFCQKRFNWLKKVFFLKRENIKLVGSRKRKPSSEARRILSWFKKQAEKKQILIIVHACRRQNGFNGISSIVSSGEFD